MRLCLLVALAALAGCAAPPGASPPPEAPPPVVVDAPIRADVVVPESLYAAVGPGLSRVRGSDANGYIRRDRGGSGSRLGSHLRLRADGLPHLSVVLASGAGGQAPPDSVSERSRYRGYARWDAEGPGGPYTVVRLGADRRVTVRGVRAPGEADRALAALDLDRLATVPATAYYLHPRTRAYRAGLAAYRAYADSLAPRPGRLAAPVALAAALPDTAGLGIAPGSEILVSPEWNRFDRPTTQAVHASGVRMLVQPPRAPLSGKRLGLPASLVLYDIADGAAVADSALAPPGQFERRGEMRVWGTGQTWSGRDLVPYDSAFVLHAGPRRRIVARGPNVPLARRLLAAVDREALAAVATQPVWLAPAPGRGWGEPGPTGTLVVGLWEAGGEVRVETGQMTAWHEAPAGWHVGAPQAVAFRPPAGWSVTGTLAVACSGGSWRETLALLRPRPLDPCSEGGVKALPDTALAGPLVALRALRPADAAPASWLLAWEGYAASLLPGWTATYEAAAGPEPAGFGEAVRLVLDGSRGERPLRVEVVFVPAGGWLFAVVGLGPPADADALREAVDRVASTLRPSPR